MAAAMLAQNAEPTGTTADLAALGEEDEDMSEMRILEQKAAMKQHKEAMAEKAGGKYLILEDIFFSNLNFQESVSSVRRVSHFFQTRTKNRLRLKTQKIKMRLISMMIQKMRSKETLPMSS